MKNNKEWQEIWETVFSGMEQMRKIMEEDNFVKKGFFDITEKYPDRLFFDLWAGNLNDNNEKRTDNLNTNSCKCSNTNVDKHKKNLFEHDIVSNKNDSCDLERNRSKWGKSNKQCNCAANHECNKEQFCDNKCTNHSNEIKHSVNNLQGQTNSQKVREENKSEFRSKAFIAESSNKIKKVNWEKQEAKKEPKFEFPIDFFNIGEEDIPIEDINSTQIEMPEHHNSIAPKFVKTNNQQKTEHKELANPHNMATYVWSQLKQENDLDSLKELIKKMDKNFLSFSELENYNGAVRDADVRIENKTIFAGYTIADIDTFAVSVLEDIITAALTVSECSKEVLIKILTSRNEFVNDFCAVKMRNSNKLAIICCNESNE